MKATKKRVSIHGKNDMIYNERNRIRVFL